MTGLLNSLQPNITRIRSKVAIRVIIRIVTRWFERYGHHASFSVRDLTPPACRHYQGLYTSFVLCLAQKRLQVYRLELFGMYSHKSRCKRITSAINIRRKHRSREHRNRIAVIGSHDLFANSIRAVFETTVVWRLLPLIGTILLTGSFRRRGDVADPRLLILDEATRSVDMYTEMHIQFGVAYFGCLGMQCSLCSAYHTQFHALFNNDNSVLWSTSVMQHPVKAESSCYTAESTASNLNFSPRKPPVKEYL